MRLGIGYSGCTHYTKHPALRVSAALLRSLGFAERQVSGRIRAPETCAARGAADRLTPVGFVVEKEARGHA